MKTIGNIRKLFLLLCLIVAGAQSSWAWTNYHVDVQDNIPINGVVYQLCHVYTREAKINKSSPMFGGGYIEYSTNLTDEYYASIVGITGSGAIEIPDTILDGGVKYGVKYVGIRTEQNVVTQEESYTYEFLGTYTATTTCYYYTIIETPVSVTASNVTKLTFKGNVTFKGNFTAASCTSMEFKKGVTISSDLTCTRLTKFVFEGNFNCTKDNGPHLKCSSLTEIYFKGTTPTLSGSWSQYSSRAASYITVYLNESQEVCNYMKTNATVWNEFKALYMLPDQAVPYHNVSISIKHGRVKVGNSSTYILKDTEYQVPQYSDFTFEVTKLYGSDYLVKSVKINGVEMLDAMTLTEGVTDAWSYYSYTISPVTKDVYISVEGESIYNWAYAISGAGGTCKWSTSNASVITPNSLSSIRWLKSSETPPSLIIIPNEGFTLDRFYYNSYDNTYRATDNGDGTFTYQMAADARASVVFKEIPPTTTWNVTLLNDEYVTAEFRDKRDDQYNYSLVNGENEVIDNAKSMIMNIYSADGTPMVLADGEDLSSSFILDTRWVDIDEYGTPITEDFYSSTIPADKLKAKNWVIGLKKNNEFAWTLKASGNTSASRVNLLGSNGTASCTVNSDEPIANTVISGSTNIPQTLQVLLAPNRSFTVAFNDADYTESFVRGETVDGLASYTYTLNPTDNTSLVANGTWLVTFAEAHAMSTDIIEFADANVKAICVANWDTNGDGELSKTEAAAVTTLKDSETNKSVFRSQKENVTSFDEFQYFTGLTTLEEYAFSGDSIKSIVLPSSITTIGNDALAYTALECISIPKGVTSIGNYAFYQSKKIKDLDLPESLTHIGDFAFSHTAIKQILIPKNVNSITPGVGADIFSDCKNLVSIVVDEGNQKYNSPNNCSAIIQKNIQQLIYGCKNTIIPEGVKGIGAQAFRDAGLKKMVIPKSVQYIYDSAFLANQLDTLVMKRLEPIPFDRKDFNSFNNSSATLTEIANCVLVVPHGKKTAYFDAGWKSIADGGYFKEVVEADDTELYDLNNDNKVDISDVTKMVNEVLNR